MSGGGPTEVTLRPGRPADAEDIALLIERENHPRVGDRERIARRLEAMPSVVAHRGDELVGFIHCRRFSPDIVELSNMVVAARMRRAGIGRAIVSMIEPALVEAGYDAAVFVNCRLHPGVTDAGAAAARHFWLRQGYAIVFATTGSAVFAKALRHG
jgi:predicted N-acetyltransferase YhbS